MKREPQIYLGDYIGGEFRRPSSPDGEWVKKSPGDFTDEVITVRFKLDHVDEAAQKAKEAFLKWSETPLAERISCLQRLKELYLTHKTQMAETISRETGKPLWEALQEAQALASKIDVTVNQSLALVASQRLENALPSIPGAVHFKSRGVMAVVGPFNFPAHLPNGHIIPALATGNTVVFKPSELTPATGQLMAQLIDQAKFPPGVFNLVQGLGETGRRLCINERVDGILFTGSYETGLKIKQETLNHYWKILALEMGGKNTSIVWDDSDMNKALYENLISSFSTCGQRCSCTSRIILSRKMSDQFISKFYETAKKIKIGHWSENPFMGPLINEASVDKYLRFQGIAKREGAETLMRGKTLDLSHQGYYVTPSINIVDKFNPKSVYQTIEIFGPNVGFYTVDDFDEALEVANGTTYGLVMSVFSKERAKFDKAVQRGQVGLVNWNRGTIGASSQLPFGGVKKSGNDRSSANFAVYYCTVPVGVLEDSNPFNPAGMAPGLEFQPE